MGKSSSYPETINYKNYGHFIRIVLQDDGPTKEVKQNERWAHRNLQWKEYGFHSIGYINDYTIQQLHIHMGKIVKTKLAITNND